MIPANVMLPETLFNTTERATLREWVEGATMPCPVCSDEVLEGDDCEAGDFAEYGDGVLARLMATAGGSR
jgi:hypothetical protein